MGKSERKGVCQLSQTLYTYVCVHVCVSAHMCTTAFLQMQESFLPSLVESTPGREMEKAGRCRR